MPEYTLRLLRFDPAAGAASHWRDYTVRLAEHRSVLDGILQARAHIDGSIAIRCSCRAAICGSCAVRINGESGLACNVHLERASRASRQDGVIEVEPMRNMAVIKDLIVDMDAVHWKNIHRVTPWLQPEGEPPEREYLVSHDAMADVTQSMACIQCGACVSDCMSLEVDPLFVGPAALAKAYRFVGDPRDAHHYQRLKVLGEDPHGIYDCTHCFQCIQVCPKGVAPMDQIMRLRRIAGSDHHIEDPNNGQRHEHAFVSNIERNGLLNESDLLADSYGGKLHPAAGAELARSLPAIATALLRRKVTPRSALIGHKLADHKTIRQAMKRIDSKPERYELNLYISGSEDEHPRGPGSWRRAPAPPAAPGPITGLGSEVDVPGKRGRGER